MCSFAHEQGADNADAVLLNGFSGLARKMIA
jgi:hypothetical protein